MAKAIASHQHKLILHYKQLILYGLIFVVQAQRYSEV